MCFIKSILMVTDRQPLELIMVTCDLTVAITGHIGNISSQYCTWPEVHSDVISSRVAMICTASWQTNLPVSQNRIFLVIIIKRKYRKQNKKCVRD